MGLLRALFGPSQDEIWSQLSQEIGARFIRGDWLHGSKVELSNKEWTLTLDTYTVSTGRSSETFTRLRAPYVNPDGFRFELYRTGFFTGLGKLLCMQDIEIGDPLFDEHFVIKSTNEEKVKQLLASQDIRNHFEASPYIHLMVKGDEGWFRANFPNGVDELYFEAYGVIRDVEQLKSLFGLFSLLLDQLCRIGSAYERDPGVRI